MKKLSLVLGVLAVLIAGFSFAACENGTGGDDKNDPQVAAFLTGTWKHENSGQTLVFTDTTFERTTSNNNKTSGSYTLTKTNDTSGSMSFKSGAGTWSAVYTYQITAQEQSAKVSLTYKSGSGNSNGKQFSDGGWIKETE